MSNLLHLIASLKAVKVTKWATGSEAEDWKDEMEDAEILQGANCVTSRRIKKNWLTGKMVDTGYHAVLLDLDVPHWLIESSTPGHSHLYVDVQVREKDYFELLDALAKCGIIETGYARASKMKGGTFLRLPWVKKEAPAPPTAVTIAPPQSPEKAWDW